MKIGVCMFYDDNVKSYGDVNFLINKLYCKKHNLSIIFSNKKQYSDRHVVWERVPLLLDNISNFDYLIWIDADAFFYNHVNSIADVINANIDANFIFSNDYGNTNINTGFFIVKNSQYSIDFLTKWGYDKELNDNNTRPHWPDQGVLIDMFDQNVLNIKENSIIIDFDILQHFNCSDDNDTQTYICHLAGRDTNTRYNVSLNYLNKISKYVMPTKMRGVIRKVRVVKKIKHDKSKILFL